LNADGEKSAVVVFKFMNYYKNPPKNTIQYGLDYLLTFPFHNEKEDSHNSIPEELRSKFVNVLSTLEADPDIDDEDEDVVREIQIFLIQFNQFAKENPEFFEEKPKIDDICDHLKQMLQAILRLEEEKTISLNEK